MSVPRAAARPCVPGCISSVGVCSSQKGGGSWDIEGKPSCWNRAASVSSSGVWVALLGERGMCLPRRTAETPNFYAVILQMDVEPSKICMIYFPRSGNISQRKVISHLPWKRKRPTLHLIGSEGKVFQSVLRGVAHESCCQGFHPFPDCMDWAQTGPQGLGDSRSPTLQHW